MTLAPPLAVGFAVAGGSPINAGEWVTVELDAFIKQRSRGILVATEPVERDGQAIEMARLAREMIVSELHAMHDLPPDEAIGRAFAAANGMLFDESQTSPTRGYDRKVLVGATAVLIDGHRCTIGHVPPGQIILIEDNLAYAVPDLGSWLPSFAVSGDQQAVPEPLGYTSWTAPILAQTELSDGDVVMVCTAALAEAMAHDLDETDMRVQDLAGYHGRSPDRSLDVFKGLLISDRIEDGAAIVIGFPPRPGAFGVVTMNDVRWRLRERRRHARAQIRGMLPRRRGQVNPMPAHADAATELDLDGEVEEALGEGNPGARSRWRLGSLISRGRPDDTWSAPSQAKQFGLPQTHGVQLHRTVSTDRGEAAWRNVLPRVPVAGPIVALFMVVLLGALVYGIWSIWPDDQPQQTDVSGALGQVDQAILAAEGATNPDDRRQALDFAEAALGSAEEDGAAPGDIAPRQAAIIEARDEIDNVIRVGDLTRVGTLPGELQQGGTSAQLTGSGLFLVNGGLYQIRTDERQIIPILEQGEVADGVEVGELFGVALDTTGLHVTDGLHAFTLLPDGEWSPVRLGEIGNLGRWEPGPVGAFGGSVYILEPEYRNIYRFDTEVEGVSEPSDWVLPSVRPDLFHAVDMAIGENIHVLIDYGRSPDEVLIYRQGDLVDRIVIPFTDGSEPAAILIGSETGLLYVAVQSEDDGAVVVVDVESDDAWQLRVPAEFSAEDAEVAAPFEGLQDIAIDEETGTLYIVNQDAVWTAQFQLPVDPAATPEASPAAASEE